MVPEAERGSKRKGGQVHLRGKGAEKRGAPSPIRATRSRLETGQAITKNIEDLRKGDLVVSRDEHDPNAELELREVQQVFVRRVYELQVISIEDNETGETQTINATGEHPFWVDGRGWTRQRAQAGRPGAEPGWFMERRREQSD